MKDKIIRLKNDKQYYVIDEVSYNEKTFIFAVRVLEEKEEVVDKSSIILEVKNVNGVNSVFSVEDKEVSKYLADLFAKRSGIELTK